MSKTGIFDFDDTPAPVVHTGDYTKTTTQGESSDKLDEQKVIKRLYSVTQGSIDTLEEYSDLDGKDLSAIVRAAIYLLEGTTVEQRKDAYKATKVVEAKRGRKPKK